MNVMLNMKTTSNDWRDRITCNNPNMTIVDPYKVDYINTYRVIWRASKPIDKFEVVVDVAENKRRRQAREINEFFESLREK